jgi:hypothetical protein
MGAGEGSEGMHGLILTHFMLQTYTNLYNVYSVFFKFRGNAWEER